MLVNLYFYNMDSQLSLFGFEEPAAPRPSKTTSKKKAGQVDGDEVVSNEASKLEDLFANTSRDENELVSTIETPIFPEEELDEADVLNQENATEEALLQTNDAEYPSEEEYAEISEALTDISHTQTEAPSNINESSSQSEFKENVPADPIVEGLDEVIVPNQEVQIIDEQLDEDVHEYPIDEELQTDSNVDPISISEEILSNTNTIDKVSTEPEIKETKQDFTNTIAQEETQKTIEPSENEEEKTKEKEPFPLANNFGKKGRKSFKEIDAEVDLINVPSDEVLFSKQYYPISQVAKWFRVNNSLLRFWENEFDILKPRKNRKGDRLFRPEDVKNLQIIYYLLRQKKYTIAGARKYIKNNRKAVDTNMKIVQTLNDFKKFLLELKANSEK